MIFSSYKFVFLFLPIVFGGYALCRKLKLYSIGKLWLVVASFYFYAQGSPDFLPYFMASVFGNYVIGSLIIQAAEKNEKVQKLLLLLGLAANIALLGYYKYTDFFITNLNAVAGTDISLRHIVLPIGISFFTFQLIAYLVDCYRGITKEYGVIDYLLFITFFPQLIVGPIVHHSEIVPQFESENQKQNNWDNLFLGIFIFSVGCAKKLLLADPLTEYAEPFFRNFTEGMGLLRAWTSTVGFTISYYFDLSGYADMAIGLGLMFNIIIPENFNSPYKARDFADYWRRWHMTLSRFLGDYIFRSVFRKGDKYRNYYVATMVTFLVSGFWHGAGWNFVAWGIVNGIFVCISNFSRRKGFSLPGVLEWLLTFLGVLATRILFVSNGLRKSVEVYRSLFDFSEFAGMSASEILHSVTTYFVNNAFVYITLIAGFLICMFAKNTSELRKNFYEHRTRYAVAAGVLFVVSAFSMGSVARFLYFQF